MLVAPLTAKLASLALYRGAPHAARWPRTRNARSASTPTRMPCCSQRAATPSVSCASRPFPRPGAICAPPGKPSARSAARHTLRALQCPTSACASPLRWTGVMPPVSNRSVWPILSRSVPGGRCQPARHLGRTVLQPSASLPGCRASPATRPEAAWGCASSSSTTAARPQRWTATSSAHRAAATVSPSPALAVAPIPSPSPSPHPRPYPYPYP